MAVWQAKLEAPAWKMLDVLIQAGRSMSLDELAEKTALARGGYFNRIVAALRGLGLVTNAEGGVRVADGLNGAR